MKVTGVLFEKQVLSFSVLTESSKKNKKICNCFFYKVLTFYEADLPVSSYCDFSFNSSEKSFKNSSDDHDIISISQRLN